MITTIVSFVVVLGILIVIHELGHFLVARWTGVGVGRFSVGVGPRVLGLARHRNLYLNCGHGHMGWTMACGTARIVADLMGGRMPELDLDGLGYR